MSKFFFLFLLLIVSHSYSQDSTKCTYKAADTQLNKIYSKVTQEYKGQALFLKRLKQAQRAWIQFRDAQIEARYPSENDTDKSKEYGSVYSECACVELAELTSQRISQLEKWLKGSPEGDVCSGSYKTKEK